MRMIWASLSSTVGLAVPTRTICVRIAWRSNTEDLRGGRHRLGNSSRNAGNLRADLSFRDRREVVHLGNRINDLARSRRDTNPLRLFLRMRGRTKSNDVRWCCGRRRRRDANDMGLILGFALCGRDTNDGWRGLGWSNRLGRADSHDRWRVIIRWTGDTNVDNLRWSVLEGARSGHSDLLRGDI